MRKCLKKTEDSNLEKVELEHEEDLRKCIQVLSEMISEEFEVKLFGYDVIGDLRRKEFFLIDINHFPGYKNVRSVVMNG